ncbi:MAG TPA: HAD family hydrolase, partial [Thermoanaerobaculia bacterium]|nr:HAD family hydrolase [Thermoanaerobaculia bacterium]
ARRYRLCCIANQPPEALAVLRDLGFERHLEHIFLDTLVHASKPDPRIFLKALEWMGASPGEVVFVGDRLDNDIAPARRLGMRTAWLKRTPRFFVPEGVDEDFAGSYHESLSRRWHHNEPASLTVTADLTAEELASLVPPSW